jgi:carbon-monoxide dehydrogenase large subunit
MNEIIDPRSVDRPNSYIGKSVPRPNAKKLVEGRGQYVDDVTLPRMVHVAFVRSPHAHAKVLAIDGSDALKMPGVLRVFTGSDLAQHCEPWVATLAHLKGMKSARSYPCRWSGRPGSARRSPRWWREAAQRPRMRLRTCASTTSRSRRGRHGNALLPATPVIHPELGDNLCFQRVNEAGKVDDAFADAHKVVEATFHSGRHTGLTVEPRSILADYNRASARLTVHHSTQART